MDVHGNVQVRGRDSLPSQSGLGRSRWPTVPAHGRNVTHRLTDLTHSSMSAARVNVAQDPSPCDRNAPATPVHFGSCSAYVLRSTRKRRAERSISESEIVGPIKLSHPRRTEVESATEAQVRLRQIRRSPPEHLVLLLE